MTHRRNPRPHLASLAFHASLAVAVFSAFLLAAFVQPASGQGTPVTAAGTPVTNTKETSLQRIQRSVAKINKEASTPEGEEAVVQRLSKQLGASPDSLRGQHAAWGLGYGEVAMVYGFVKASKKPGVTPNQVVEWRMGGMEWDVIGRELGVNVEAVASKMRKHAQPKPHPQPQPK